MFKQLNYSILALVLFWTAPLFANQIHWQSYNAASFEKARDENKLLLLDLKANWCHWCHVMDQKTYATPEVIRYINKHYVAMKVDHDARPDLAERYRKWGWPATVILTADGNELHKQAGYINPDKFLNLITHLRNSPQDTQTLQFPKNIARSPHIEKSLEQRLIKRNLQTFDSKEGSLKLAQKFIDPEAIIWDFQLAKRGDKSAKKRIQLTLDKAIALVDPVFGGAYQYSTHGDWKHPHYEKIMTVQATYLMVYAKAYQFFKDPRYLNASESIANYLNRFMSDPNGGFYTSQDADLKQGNKAHDYYKADFNERMKQGIPKIDKNQYSAENALAIDGLLHLYEASQNRAYLKRASDALLWVEKNRGQGDGGYRHAQKDPAGPYLADTLNMGIAWLHLYQISQLDNMKQKAEKAAAYIKKHFMHQQAGFLSAADNGTPVPPLPQIDQNIRATRFFLMLYQESKKTQHLKLAEQGLRYLNTPDVALSRLTDAGILSVNQLYRQITKNRPARNID